MSSLAWNNPLPFGPDGFWILDDTIETRSDKLINAPIVRRNSCLQRTMFEDVLELFNCMQKDIPRRRRGRKTKKVSPFVMDVVDKVLLLTIMGGLSRAVNEGKYEMSILPGVSDISIDHFEFLTKLCCALEIGERTAYGSLLFIYRNVSQVATKSRY